MCQNRDMSSKFKTCWSIMTQWRSVRPTLKWTFRMAMVWRLGTPRRGLTIWETGIGWVCSWNSTKMISPCPGEIDDDIWWLNPELDRMKNEHVTVIGREIGFRTGMEKLPFVDDFPIKTYDHHLQGISQLAIFDDGMRAMDSHGLWGPRVGSLVVQFSSSSWWQSVDPFNMGQTPYFAWQYLSIPFHTFPLYKSWQIHILNWKWTAFGITSRSNWHLWWGRFEVSSL